MILNAPRPKKEFSQNFLVDEALLARIAQSVGIKKNDYVIEIGPGTGNLTHYLLNYDIHLHLIEIDQDMIDCLKHRFKQLQNQTENLNIYHQSILDFNFDTDLNLKNNSLSHSINTPVKIVSNLPYHLTSPILFHLYNQKLADCQVEMVLMMQKEVALRVSAKSNHKNYSRLSVMSQLHAEIEYLFDVPKSSFWPIPKVDSAVLRFLIKPINHHFAIEFASFIKICFAQKRKKISNNLKSGLTQSAFHTLSQLSDNLKIDLNKRAENISLDQYLDLFKLYKQLKLTQ